VSALCADFFEPQARRYNFEFMKKLRIGFLSAAGIARKNWKAIFSSGSAVVAAVASRDVEKSRKFVDECQSQFSFPEKPRALGSYEELLASPDIDAVYIPLPTGLRKKWVLRAAAAGKHVVCEKPCGVSTADLKEMIAACAKNRVMFMDGVMFMHSPRLPAVRKVLDDGKSLGGIRRISSAFNFLGHGNFFRASIRTDGALEPAGCLGDLGWYNIRFSLWAMNWQLPHTVTGKILSQSAATGGRVPAPTEFSGELFFDGGVSAGFYCSFVAQFQQWVVVSGEKGYLRMPDFVHVRNAPAFEVNGTEVRVKVPGAVRRPPSADPLEMGHATAQDTWMWRNYAKQIATGKLNKDWPMWSLKTQIVLDACLKAGRIGKPVKI
jgi:predicted dehydrogenase